MLHRLIHQTDDLGSTPLPMGDILAIAADAHEAYKLYDDERLSYYQFVQSAYHRRTAIVR